MIWSKSRSPKASLGRPRAVVVTGASSGIGRAAAMKLARSGFRVFAGVRKEEDAEALEETASAGRLKPLFIDVTDEHLVASAASTVEEAVGGEGIAGLVNNAGIGEAWPLEYVPLEEFRSQFEVNVFGHLTVTQAFLPLIRAATGRIVNVGSVGGRITMPFGGTLSAPRRACRRERRAADGTLPLGHTRRPDRGRHDLHPRRRQTRGGCGSHHRGAPRRWPRTLRRLLQNRRCSRCRAHTGGKPARACR